MKNTIRIMIAGFAATIMMMGAPAKAEANPISDAASTAWHTAGHGAAMITGAINNGIETITDLMNEACNFATHDACDWLSHQTQKMLEEILAGCKHFNACDWLLAQPTKLIEPAALWMSNHPEDAALIQLGLMVLIPIGTQAIIAKATVPEFISGIGTETIAGFAITESDIDSISIPSIRQTLIDSWNKAIANEDETFSLCEEPIGQRKCGLPEGFKDPRKWMGSNWPDYILNQLAESKGMTLEELKAAMTNGDLAIDHILPLSCGGTNDIANLQILTTLENSAKGNFNGCTKIPIGILD